MTTRYLGPVPQSRRVLPALAILGTLGFFSWLPGCSVLVDANRAQCSTDTDCTERGADFVGAVCKAGLCEVNPQWSCDAAQASATPGYKLTMHLQDAVSSEPLPGILAQRCHKLDLTCENPVAMTTADMTGGVTMQVEAAFDGYVQLTGPKIAPALYFLTPPTSGDLDLPSVPLATPLAAAGIVLKAGGTTWDKQRGLVLLNAFDCEGKAAANITFSIGGTPDPNTFIFYLVDAFPTTTVGATDDTGYGGLVNVPEGVSTISALLEPGARKVSKISVLVRAGYISYSRVTPNSL
jgi:hypothetical protein